MAYAELWKPGCAIFVIAAGLFLFNEALDLVYERVVAELARVCQDERFQSLATSATVGIESIFSKPDQNHDRSTENRDC